MSRYRFSRMFPCRGRSRCLQGRRSVRSSHPRNGARAMLISHNPWREEDDVREKAAESWIPERGRILASKDPPLPLKVKVERAQSATRAQRTLGGPYEGRRRRSCRLRRGGPPYIRTPGRRRRRLRPCDWRLPKLRQNFDWSFASTGMSGAGFPGEAVSSTWIPKRMAQYRTARQRDDLPDERARGGGNAPRAVRSKRRAAIPNRASSEHYKRLGRGNNRVQTAATSHRRRIWYREVIRYPLPYGPV